MPAVVKLWPVRRSIPDFKYVAIGNYWEAKLSTFDAPSIGDTIEGALLQYCVDMSEDVDFEAVIEFLKSECHDESTN